jgi:hypothetical protein
MAADRQPATTAARLIDNRSHADFPETWFLTRPGF